MKNTIYAGAERGLGKARLALVGGVFASIMIAITAFTGTASAAASDCSSGGPIVCFWIDANYTNLRTDYYNPAWNNCYGFSSTFNDQISSIANHTTLKMNVYRDAGCPGLGAVMSIAPNTDYANLSGTGMNDEISSFKMVFP